jgi:hypothetical protein
MVFALMAIEFRELAPLATAAPSTATWLGVSAGVRLLLTGLIIVGVITAAGGQKALR